jgi:hypothetical protein
MWATWKTSVMKSFHVILAATENTWVWLWKLVWVLTVTKHNSRCNSDAYNKTSFWGICDFMLVIAQQTGGYHAEMPISARSPLISTIIMKTRRNGPAGPSMKLEKGQELTGKMFIMISTLGRSRHLLKLHQRLLPQKTPTASPRSTTSWVRFLVCLVFIKTLNIVRSSVKLVWGLGNCSMRWSHVLLVVKR